MALELIGLIGLFGSISAIILAVAYLSFRKDTDINVKIIFSTNSLINLIAYDRSVLSFEIEKMIKNLAESNPTQWNGIDKVTARVGGYVERTCMADNVTIPIEYKGCESNSVIIIDGWQRER